MMLDQKLISHLDVHHIYILVYFKANRSIKTSEKINQEVHLGDHNFKNNENFQPNIQNEHPDYLVVSHVGDRHLPDDCLIQT